MGMMQKQPSKIASFARRFRRDDDGNISLEFVVVTPVLIFLFFSCFAAFEAFRTYSQVAKTAYTLTDIASRMGDPDSAEPLVTDAAMVELFDLHKMLLPGRVTDGYLRISSICYNGEDDDPYPHRVAWSYIGDDTYLAAIADDEDEIDPRLLPMSNDDIPLDIIPALAENDSVILAEVYAVWSPISVVGGFETLVFQHALTARPRHTINMIPYDASEIVGYPNSADSLCPEEVAAEDSGAGELPESPGTEAEGTGGEGGDEVVAVLPDVVETTEETPPSD
ncbi:MAG: TadE/TadG family type IV pilus assembly protein [Pseudomonadota bacterium]